MYNFHNLCDFEFEMLCKDIMSRKLKKELRIFGKGRDDGIDLTDDCKNKDIIVQVKHYINSSFSNLKSSLNREFEKVEKLNPNQYYICCSKTLSPRNIEEIYEIFKDYMNSDENIITLNEINDFLEKSENVDIVRKNYKLWLESTNILSEINNQSIFIDCESLLYNIEEQSTLFVETDGFIGCKQMLNKERILILIGSPGVGKTITTKMLALFFASIKYRIRYTTNGSIRDLKQSISVDKEQKEVIILDDCLGQHYFSMKSTQESELLSLIKYILMNKNKILILNSRVTIFNEAQKRSQEFKMFIEDKKIKLFIINMDETSNKDKGLIFYNHLHYKRVPEEYYNNLKEEKMYVKIVNHKNYNPRIMEFVTRKVNYTNIQPNNYSKYILSMLDNPDKIWEDEFTNKIREQDRIFMTTLYSLTDLSISLDILSRSYNYRIRNNANIDTTINVFENVISRLNCSFITLYDNNGKKEVGVVNPSVNDYLKQYIKNNQLEINNINENITEYVQLKRMERYDKKLITTILENGKILELNYFNMYEKMYIIISYICKYNITNNQYRKIIQGFLSDLKSLELEDSLNRNQIIIKLLQEPFFSFYQVNNYLTLDNIEKFFNTMTIDDICEFIKESIENKFKFEYDDVYVSIINKNITRAVYKFIEEIKVEDYIENYDISDLIKIYSDYNESDYDTTISTIEEWIQEDVYEEIEELISVIPKKFITNLDIKDSIEINRESIDMYIESYIIAQYEPDYDYPDDPQDFNFREENEMEILDIIFK